MVFLLVHVDDIIIIGSKTPLVDNLIRKLAASFSIKDLGALFYFLGVEVLSTPHGLYLSQRKYIQHILTKTRMADTKPVLLPMATSPV